MLPFLSSPLTRLVLAMAGISVFALVAGVMFSTVENMQDPDGDGIPTADDPAPFVFNGDLDADGDGWTNGYERMRGTSLIDPDEDRDGLPDGQDEDGDGMGNWFERNVAGLDPTVKNGRYYVQLMSVPFSNVNETENRAFWVEKEKLPKEHYIVEYAVTLPRFREIVRRLAQEMTEEDLLYLYVKTHGERGGAEPTLCFANESAPTAADRCGEIITYRALDGILDTIPCRAMVVVYSSCAGESAVEVLSGGRCPRMVAAVMGVTAGIPSVDAGVVNATGDGYFSAADLVRVIAAQSSAECGVAERVADREAVAGRFYYGEYPKVLYREEGPGRTGDGGDGVQPGKPEYG